MPDCKKMLYSIYPAGTLNTDQPVSSKYEKSTLAGPNLQAPAPTVHLNEIVWCESHTRNVSWDSQSNYLKVRIGLMV